MAIAASVFVLAAELIYDPAETPSRLRRFPWVMAGAFERHGPPGKSLSFGLAVVCALLLAAANTPE